MTEQTIQSKSQLAKLLATENISFQHSPSAKTAYFDIKNRVLVLPVWKNISNDLYDMLVVHEVGHALDTPVDGWIQAIDNIALKIHGSRNKRYQGAIKGFLNVIEDARIDKRQKRRYPGSKRNYIAGYKELIERDFFGTSKKDVNDMSFIDRLNMYFKGGAMGTLGRIIFSKEEAPFVKRIENAETFEEVIQLTEEVYAFSKAKGEEQQQQMEDFRQAEGDDDGDGDGEYDFDDESDEYDNDTDGDGDADGDSDGEESGEETESDSGKSKPEEHTDDENDGVSESYDNKGHGEGDDVVPESETEKAWEENISNILADNDVNYIYVETPKPIMDEIVDDYKVVLKQMSESLFAYSRERVAKIYEDFNKFKAEENATISFMVKEFESRKSAETYSKISIAKTGVIDTNKLHSYRYNEDIFRRLATTPTGKNHGFVMILDWSGSMQSDLKKTVKQLISLTMFCKRVQIPFEVYFFRDKNQVEYNSQKNCFEYKAGSIQFGNFKMRNILSSRMNISDLNLAYTLLWAAASDFRFNSDGLGSTPLNQAIVATEVLVNQFRKRNKLEIVNTIFLTDGDSNPVGGYVHGPQDNQPYKPKGNRYILKDDVSKKEYNLGNGLNGYDNALTNAFLRILKDRTNSNLIGFFLCSDSLRYISYKHLDTHDVSKYQEQWRSNKFIAVKSSGYDEYYILNAKGMDIVAEGYKIDTNMTRSKIAKEFQKFSEKKAVNRVLLTRFIEKISSQSKMVA